MAQQQQRGVLLAALLLIAGACAASATGAPGDWSRWYWGEFRADEAKPTTFDVAEDFAVVRDLWFHVNRFYAVMPQHDFDAVEGNATDIPFSQNVAVGKLPVRDVAAHYRNIEAGRVDGTVLWLDFPFPAFPENMGHWVETLLPVYSQLSLGAWKAHVPEGDGYINAVLFPNLRREAIQAIPWVLEVVRLAIKPGLPKDLNLPRVLFFDELEGTNATDWLGFQRVVQMFNRYRHPAGRSGFATPQLAAQFRDAVYQAANISRSGDWEARVAPPVITYLMAVGGEHVVNNDEVLAMLHAVGARLGLRVQPYTVTGAAPFASFVATMAHTGVLVARHGPLLANAAFLPPGAVVLELLPYNWEWQGISEIYVNVTRSMGDVHHFAWRARSPDWVLYATEDDVKYAHWTPEECASRYCLEAHARAGMIVDTRTVERMLMELLPPARRGASVEVLQPRMPWPSRHAPTGKTGMWWEL